MALEAWQDDREHAELLYDLGQAQRGAARWEDALATWTRALDLLEQPEDRERFAEIAWHVGYQLLWSGRRDELAQILGRSLTRLEGVDSVSHARLLLGAAAGFGSVDQFELAVGMLEKADQMSSRLPESAVLTAEVEQARCFVLWTFPVLEEALASARRAVDLLREAGAQFDLANVESFLTSALSVMGRDEEAFEIGARAAEAADRLGHLGAHIYVSRALEPIKVQTTGDVEGFLAHMEAEAGLAREAGITWAESNALWHAALAELWLGRSEAALARSKEMGGLDVPASFMGWNTGIRALLEAVAGDAGRARTIMDSKPLEVSTPGREISTGAWMHALFSMEACAVLGDWDGVAAWAPVLEGLPRAGFVRRVIDSRSMDAHRGLAAAAAGDAGETSGGSRPRSRMPTAAASGSRAPTSGVCSRWRWIERAARRRRRAWRSFAPTRPLVTRSWAWARSRRSPGSSWSSAPPTGRDG